MADFRYVTLFKGPPVGGGGERRRCPPPPQAVAGEIDAVGVVDEPVEDGVGVGRIADQFMPAVDRDLAGDDRRAPAVALLDDLEEIVAGAGRPQSSRMRSWTPARARRMRA